VAYQSKVIPSTTIGWFYNLKPQLAEQVRQAILTFEPKADSDASGVEPLHFLAVDYEKEFQVVREIDDRFDPRLDSKAKLSKAATTQTAT